MRRFYSNNIQENYIYLDLEESRHIAKVLRLKTGDKVEVINGSGLCYIAELTTVDPRACVLVIKDTIKSSGNEYGIHLAVAPTKNINRWEWFIEKATEIGVDQITPMLCTHSERKALKLERQERIVIAAAKQSHKTKFPQISSPTTFAEIVSNTQAEEKFIAHCYEEIPRQSLIKLHQSSKKVLILIGPEGDFSKEELDMALKNGFQSVELSKSRLRTETAAIVACNTLHNV